MLSSKGSSERYESTFVVAEVTLAQCRFLERSTDMKHGLIRVSPED